jgi:serine/threonine-protein kinase HipA
MAYHKSCLKKLFDSEKIPIIEFKSTDIVYELSKTIGKMSISGVQIKASVKLNKKSNIIEIVKTGGTHILKPGPSEYPNLPQNENLCMNLAAIIGIETPPHGLFYMADKKLCYIIKRFDRDKDDHKIHVEDMAQLLELPSNSKYESSLEKVGKALLVFSSKPYLDLILFIERVIFCFLIGNGDMHLKNWSIIRNLENDYRLSPAYDLISSKLYLPEEDESALTLNGKRRRIKSSDFKSLSDYLSIESKSFENAINKIIERKIEIMQFIDVYSKSESSFTEVNKITENILKMYERIEKTA